MLPDVSDKELYSPSEIEELFRRQKDGRPLLCRLFEIYREESPVLLEELKEAFEAGDAEACGETLHQMKGSAGAMAASRMFSLCEATLSMCADGSVLKLDGLVERLRSESAAFVAAIEGLLRDRGF